MTKVFARTNIPVATAILNRGMLKVMAKDIPNDVIEMDLNNIIAISFAITFNMPRFKIAVATGILVLANTFVIGFSISHLWIICRLLFVEDTNIFMLT